MTEPADVVAALAELSRRYLHGRVGQRIANVAGWADAKVRGVEDEQLLLRARHEGSLQEGVEGKAVARGGAETPRRPRTKLAWLAGPGLAASSLRLCVSA